METRKEDAARTARDVEFQVLGDTTKLLSDGDGQRVIASGGFGFSY